MKPIYLDYAASTPIRKEVVEEMNKAFEVFGNPSSVHQEGQKAKELIDSARETIAKILNCSPDEIIFTSGATEAINLAIKGVMRANKHKGNHIVTTKVEHSAVLNACKALEKDNIKTKLVDVKSDGIVDINDVRAAMNDKTVLVSVMYANNEIGTIQPITEIGKICREKKIYFLVDASAAGLLDLDVKKLNCDMLALDGSKIYGPKGTGILYVKHGILLEPQINGGGQQSGVRSGTENVPSIVGFARALELLQQEKKEESQRLEKSRNKLMNKLLEKIPESSINGNRQNRLPNNVNISILGVEGRTIVKHLDHLGIAVSTGSACGNKSDEPSHVLIALGLNYQRCNGSLRITLGKETTDKDINYVIDVLPQVVESLWKATGRELNRRN